MTDNSTCRTGSSGSSFVCMSRSGWGGRRQIGRCFDERGCEEIVSLRPRDNERRLAEGELMYWLPDGDPLGVEPKHERRGEDGHDAEEEGDRVSRAERASRLPRGRQSGDP